jgi:hypothetical protein
MQMSENDQPDVPERGDLPVDAAGSSAAQTNPEGNQSSPATEASTPRGMTREEAAVLFREQLSSVLPDLASQFEARYAKRSDLDRAAQSASDRRFAKLMKGLAPEMRGIDKMVAKGLMDPYEAKQAKQELFLEEAAKLAEEPEPPPPAAAPPRVPARPAPRPEYNPNRVMQDAATRLLSKHGLNWGSVNQEVRSWMAQHPGAQGMPFEEFSELVVTKSVASRDAQRTQQAVRKLEENAARVRESDRQGATLPPVGAVPSENREDKIKRRYKHSGRVGEAFVELFKEG